MLSILLAIVSCILNGLLWSVILVVIGAVVYMATYFVVKAFTTVEA